MSALEIRSRAQECRKQFELLIGISGEIGSVGETEDDCHDVGWIEDQFARFKMWAGNIGAFAEGHASLDYRLRDDETTKQFMLDFLVALTGFINRAIASLRPDPTCALPSRADSPVRDDRSIGDVSLETATSSAISSSFQGTETDSVQDEVTSAEAIDNSLPVKRLQGIEKAIDRLYRLSLIIRQPSRSAQNEKAEQFKMKDDEGNDINDSFSAYAYHIVNHQFPDAPEFLRVKLSHGILIRRKRFLYRQRHQRKLSKVDLYKNEEKSRHLDTERTENVESTVRAASGVADERLPGKSSDPNLTPPRTFAPSQTSASAIPKQPLPLTTALEDAKSNQSTIFTATPSMSAPVEIPHPPIPLAGSKEFECPYCCLILPIKQSTAFRWRRHVMDDLEAYTCVFENCTDDAKFFQDRHSWIAHLQTHKTTWRCTSRAHSTVSLPSEEEYFAHMRNQHSKSFAESQLPLLAKRSLVPASIILPQCPLCSYIPNENEVKILSGVSQVQRDKAISDCIMKHLAAHLEALAIKALPWQDNTENRSEDRSKNRSQTDKVEDVTAQSEGGSHVISFSDSGSLHFPEEADDDYILEDMPIANEEIIPPLDSAYNEDWGFIKRKPYFGHDRDETLQPLLQRLFLQDAVSNAVTGPKLPAYLVPLAQDKSFWGREYALNAIKQTLCKSSGEDFKENKPLSWPRCYAVYGPGGMGKTQIAAQFVFDHKDEFDAVLWVHAEDSSKIAQDYKDLAIGLGLVTADSRDAMDLDYTRDVLKRWLVNPQKDKTQEGEKTPEKASWLLVFDGVEDGEILNGFWPYNGPGSVLITSRNPYSWSSSLELKPFNISEATQYLFHMTGREPTPADEVTAATAIATRLGGLPLALKQMGSIVMSKNISFAGFLLYFQQHEGSPTLFDWRFPNKMRSPSHYESNVASVWAFDRLEKGAILINVISMLDPDAIPESIFTSPISNNDSELARLLKVNYIDARNELLARSLITDNKREKRLFVHRLVQDVARTRLRQSEIRRYFLACVELINSKWPFQELTWRHGTARWADCEELFPHLQRLKSMFPSLTPSPDSFEDYEFARLLIDSGWYQHERGKSPDAILSNNMAQSICESLKLRLLERPDLDQENTGILSKLNYSLHEITHNRGCIALEINEPSDALRYHTMFNESMMRKSPKSNTEDIRLAISWNELGNAHMLNHDWKRGEECFLKSIEEMRKAEKFEVILISLPLVNLGQAYWLQGKNELASKTLLQGLQDRENEFGREDRVSFITGRYFHALGNVENNPEYHRRALMHYKATLGNRHHRTADVFVKVAQHNISLGYYDLALALLDHSLDVFSISHTYMPEKTRAGWMRYKALEGLGRTEEADNELANCYQAYTEICGKHGKRRLEIKNGPDELNDEDMDDLIVFWSK